MIQRFVICVDGADHEVALEPLDGARWRVTIDGAETLLDACPLGAAGWSLVAASGGPAFTVDIEEREGELIVSTRGQRRRARVTDARRFLAEAAASSATRRGPERIRAPMPGKVIKILVAKGEAVAAGQGVIIVEAMKMENEMRATSAGTVVGVTVEEGAAVEAGQVLLEIA